MKRTSVLRNEFDERLYAGVVERRQYIGTDNELVLAHYVAEARRVGWPWRMVAEALGTSSTVAKRLYRVHLGWALDNVRQTG